MDNLKHRRLKEETGNTRKVPGESRTLVQINPINGAGRGEDPLAQMIDHTLLRPDATAGEIETLCGEALKFGFASVCVNPFYVPRCAKLLQGTKVKVCTVIGFPLGATSTAAKYAEAERAVRDGATELDMVMNVGMLKSGSYDLVLHDVSAVAKIAHQSHALCKVIIETGLLTEREKVKACILVKDAGADFVKTSTGFSKGGATVEDITLIRRVVGSAMGVKASGGIRDREAAAAMIAAGANRIGTSSGVTIVSSESAVISKGS